MSAAELFLAEPAAWPGAVPLLVVVGGGQDSRVLTSSEVPNGSGSFSD